MSGNAGQHNGTLWVTIREGARRLGLTEAAIRRRIKGVHCRRRTARTARCACTCTRCLTSLTVSHRCTVKLGYKTTSWSGSSRIGCARWSGGWTRRECRRRADTIIAQLTQANSALAPGGRRSWRSPRSRDTLPKRPLRYRAGRCRARWSGGDPRRTHSSSRSPPRGGGSSAHDPENEGDPEERGVPEEAVRWLGREAEGVRRGGTKRLRGRHGGWGAWRAWRPVRCTRR